MTEKAAPAPLARTVVQQCVHARLQVSPPGPDSEAEWVQVGRGMVIYVCFFKGATEDMLPKMVSTLLNQRLCERPSGGLASVLDLQGSVLVVPQATLGGRAKGRAMQYHGNISKDDGLRLYQCFVSLCQAQLQAAGGETRGGAKGAGGETRGGAKGAGGETRGGAKGAGGETRGGAKGAGAEPEVKHGTYGNRQVLQLDTNGPYTHLMEF
ncbi:unnamed protein product [Lota lota]